MLNKILKKDKYIALFSVLALFLVLGVSYAVVSWTTDDYNIALDSACMDINYVKGKNINASLGGTVNESAAFVDSEVIMNSNMTFTTVDMELDEDCYDINGLATIKINISNLSNSFKAGGSAAGHLKYVVAEYDPAQYQTLNMSVLEGKKFQIVAWQSVYNEGIIDAYTTYLEPGVKKSYLVIFYIQSLNIVSSGTFSASIDTEVVQTEETLPEYTPISDFTYYIGTYNNLEIPEGSVLLTKYNGSNPVVNIPSKYTIDGNEYRPIVSTSSSSSTSCFKGNTNITKVFFPSNILFYYYDGTNLIKNSVRSLFSDCKNLTEVSSLGSAVTNMYFAFSNCSSLVNAPVIPNSVTDMSYTFDGCTSLVNAPVIPNSVTSLGNTFNGCTSLVDAPVIPNSVTGMSSTFRGCTSLVNAPAIPNSVTNIDFTFEGCTSLVNAPVIPNSVTSLGNTFKGCTSLVDAPVIPNSVTYMISTFNGCTSLVNAPVIPNSVTSMGYTFNGCTSLVDAPVIPNSVTLMNYTFKGCTGLVNAPEIPSSVINMTGTFASCTNLTGTVRINSSSASRSSGASDHPFYNTSKPITVEVPANSTTYTRINTNKPSNVTIVTY